ncbi:MAG TPA: hypothetical protein PK263_05595, partial [bacterium]|nr:hypothetical protein [bacterium]
NYYTELNLSYPASPPAGSSAITRTVTLSTTAPGVTIASGAYTFTLQPQPAAAISFFNTSAGECGFYGGNEITATILCYENFKYGPNSTFKGSFVSNKFGTSAGENTVASNVNFFYDYSLNTSVPPGFQSVFKMTQGEIGNR